MYIHFCASSCLITNRLYDKTHVKGDGGHVLSWRKNLRVVAWSCSVLFSSSGEIGATPTHFWMKELRVGFDLHKTCWEMSHCLGRHQVQTWFWCMIWHDQANIWAKSKWAPSWTALFCSQVMAQTWWNKAGLHKVRCFGLILWQFATLTERARVVQLACPSKMRKKVDSRVRTLARDSVVSTNSEYQTTQT